MKKSQFIIDYESKNGKYYMLHTQSGNIVSIDREKKFKLYEILNNLDKNKKHKAVDVLANLGFVVPKSKDEYQLATGDKVIKDIKNNYLDLIIMPTEKCNFRCVYCYENFEKPKMSKEVQNAIIQFVNKELPRHKGLSVGWFGGEPLLATDVVASLSEAFIELCKKHKKPYRASMTTNGYLLNLETFKKMLHYKINHFQITIDGDKSIHDTQRILVNKKGTFDTIINNLNEIKNNSQSKLWTISLRTNVTTNVIKNIDQFKKDIISNFSNDSRFYIMLRQMWTNNTDEADSIVCTTESFENFVENCNIGYQSLYQEYSL